ncbi:MAG TPA: hypothetical protein VNM48_12045, partial [Chloroflexota bacterium]|nr:hypothetical protein [Chloroflexota bacterium]
SGNPVAGEVAKGQVARLAGEVGALTDSDLSRFGGSRAIADSISRMITKAENGQMEEGDLKALEQAATILEKAAMVNRQAVGKEHSRSFVRINGGDEATVYGQLTGYDDYAPDAPKKDPPAPGKAAHGNDLP